MNVKTAFSMTLCLLLIGLAAVQPAAAAQEAPDFELGLRKDFGYASLLSGEMQGTFTISARGREDLSRVVFYLDDQVLGEVNAAPFRLRFDTGNYELGSHRLYAVATTTDGQEVRSEVLQRTFVFPERGWSSALKIAGPLLAIALLASLLSAVIPFIGGKKGASGKRRSYGPAGGAICPKCQLPFSRHFLSPNLLVGKLERCPHCGKWSIVSRAPEQMLRIAEELEDAQAGASGSPTAPDTEEERLRRALEESRYQDL